MFKASLFIFLMISLLISLPNMEPVYAYAGGSQQSTYDPNAAQVIKSLMGVRDVVYESTGPFIYAPSITVERFKADGFRYEVTENYQIVHFQPISDDNFHNFPSYKMDRELYKPKAIALILHLDPGAVLEQLVFQANVDDGYFRWENNSKNKFPNGQYPSIQVVYAPDGRLFSYTNTMNIDSELLVNTELSVSPMVIVTTLAAPGSYFTTTGSWTDQSGGWGYHGSNFYFTPGGNSNTGKWTYSLSGSFYSYAYIPNYPGSLASYARYTTSYAFQNQTSILCNQNLHKDGYCIPITQYNGAIDFHYTKIDGPLSASSEKLVADELFIYQ